MLNKLENIIDNIEYNNNNTDEKASELRAERYKQKTKQQKHWSLFIMGFISVWSVFDFLLITFSKIQITEIIVTTLLTTTLAQIIALPIIICKYLFPQETNK